MKKIVFVLDGNIETRTRWNPKSYHRFVKNPHTGTREEEDVHLSKKKDREKRYFKPSEYNISGVKVIEVPDDFDPRATNAMPQDGLTYEAIAKKLVADAMYRKSKWIIHMPKGVADGKKGIDPKEGIPKKLLWTKQDKFEASWAPAGAVTREDYERSEKLYPDQNIMDMTPTESWDEGYRGSYNWQAYTEDEDKYFTGGTITQYDADGVIQPEAKAKFGHDVNYAPRRQWKITNKSLGNSELEVGLEKGEAVLIGKEYDYGMIINKALNRYRPEDGIDWVKISKEKMANLASDSPKGEDAPKVSTHYIGKPPFVSGHTRTNVFQNQDEAEHKGEAYLRREELENTPEAWDWENTSLNKFWEDPKWLPYQKLTASSGNGQDIDSIKNAKLKASDLSNWNKEASTLRVSKSGHVFESVAEHVLNGYMDEYGGFPRYWSHIPPRNNAEKDYAPVPPTKEGGIQAYKIGGHSSEAQAISGKFKKGMNQKIIWLFYPARPNDPYVVDATKLNLWNVSVEASGLQHGGDIPPEALVKKPIGTEAQKEKQPPLAMTVRRSRKPKPAIRTTASTKPKLSTKTKNPSTAGRVKKYMDSNTGTSYSSRTSFKMPKGKRFKKLR